MKSKSDSQRYNLHRRARKLGFRINVSERTIFAPYGMKEFPKAISVLFDKFKYAIQFEIPE